MNKYVIPVCAINTGINKLVKISARTYAEAEEKCIQLLSNKYKVSEECFNLEELKETLDTKYDVLIGYLDDIETL